MGDLTRPKALRVWAGVIAVIGLMAWVALTSSSLGPWRYDGVVTGYTRGAFQQPSKYGVPPLAVSVEVDTGRTITVGLPKSVPYRPDSRVQLKAFHKGEGSEQRVRYTFAGYREDTD